MSYGPENGEDRLVTRMYHRDSGTIIFAVMATWAVLAFVLHECLPLSDSPRVRLIIEASAAAVGISATAALVALLGHLRRNRSVLYREDLDHLTTGDK